jgi:hypothetical protein
MAQEQSIVRSGWLKTLQGVFAAVAMFCLVAPAAAQSLREMRAQEAEEATLRREAAFTEQLCGISFDVSIDWRSFADWPEGAAIARACDRGLSEIETSCRRGETPRLSRFVCTGDGSGAGYSGGAMTYGTSPN